jgi:hypothetical protein
MTAETASPFSPKVVAPEGARPSCSSASGSATRWKPLAEHRPAAEYYQLAERYGITIADDWIEEMERAHGVKL